jgi:hypothetical protein
MLISICWEQGAGKASHRLRCASMREMRFHDVRRPLPLEPFASETSPPGIVCARVPGVEVQRCILAGGAHSTRFLTQNGPRVIYISADLFISRRVFSFRRPVHFGVCREFQAFAARRFAAARKKGGISGPIVAQSRAILGPNYKNRRREIAQLPDGSEVRRTCRFISRMRRINHDFHPFPAPAAQALDVTARPACATSQAASSPPRGASELPSEINRTNRSLRRSMPGLSRNPRRNM